LALNAAHLRFVLLARDSGVRFERPLMIGRQELFIGPAELRRVLAAAGTQLTEEHARRLLEEEGGFAEPFFRLLGAAHVDSVDLSSYEGATIIQDLNAPVPAVLRNRYSVVIDSGTLEHVFNVAQGFRNCLEMIEEGGYFITIGPGNNAMGHGFYQFSPELYFRILSSQNGFHIERMAVKEMHSATPWYSVTDPAVVGHRVEWQPVGETHVMVCARKERTVPIFGAVPQQSDYTAATRFDRAPTAAHHHVDQSIYSDSSARSLRRLVWQRVPPSAKAIYRRLKRLLAVLNRAMSHPDPTCFKRLDASQLSE